MATTIAATVPGGVDSTGTMMTGAVMAGGGGIAGIITITTVTVGHGTATAAITIGIATAAGEAVRSNDLS